MSDQSVNVPQEILDLDLSTIDTSFTVIRAGLYDCVVRESSIERTSNDDGDMWVLKLSTLKPTVDVKNAPVKEGQILFHRIGLRPTDKYSHEAIAKNTARFVQAVKPSITGIKAADLFNGEIKTKCKLFEGRMLQVKVEALPEGIDKKSGRSLPARNEVVQLVPASKAA